jgi:lipopolysaccharide export system ATP-binding protein
MMPILEAEGLVKIYGRRRVVDGVSLQVEPGEIVGLLGPNGAGKTTSFKMICGLVKPAKGKVYLQGTDVTRWPMHERSRSGSMGYLPQQASVFGKLSAEQNLRGMMQLLGFSHKQQKTRCEELLDQFKIAHIRKTKAGSLSGGERRRLEIARCLVSDPKIIMLDEPFAGIDPVTVQNIQVVIKELSQAGIAVLITDHAAREILQITDRTYVVSEGRILCSGTAEQIVAHDEVKKKYLGEIELPTTRLDIDPDGTTTRIANNDVKPTATVSLNKTTDTQPRSPEPTFSETATKVPENPRLDERDQQVVSMLNAIGKSTAAAKAETANDRPKIVFSKPRRSTRNVATPLKSNDLD